MLLSILSTAPVVAADATRFRDRGVLSDSAAEWVSRDEDRLVYGAQAEVVFARVSDPPRFDFRVTLPQVAREAVFAGERLYWSTGTALNVLDVEHLDRGSIPVESIIQGRSLRVARMDEYLLVLERGFGLRILALPPPPGHRTPQHSSHIGRLPVVAGLRLPERVLALASSSRRIYIATSSGELMVVNASRPDAPIVEGRIPLEGMAVRALAANGPQAWLLGREGLAILDTSVVDAPRRIVGRFPAVTGEAIELAGRTLHLAAGSAGLRTLLDTQMRMVTHTVTVSNTVFTPNSLTINVGDTVQWNNVAGLHSVDSCDGISDPVQCGGQVAAEGSFSSGAPASAPWSFSRVFNVVGNNRYFCSVHVGLGMVGTITTSAPAPPGVPDGGVGTPLTVNRLNPTGTELSVSFDTSTCAGNAGHHLIFGFGSNLPSSLAGTYDPTGGVCLIGSSPLIWIPVPDPSIDPTRLLWFLVLANDGSTTEGSWGSNSAGERNGPAANGSSNQCSIATKDLTNSCGQ